jgi:hypothetical protein
VPSISGGLGIAKQKGVFMPIEISAELVNRKTFEIVELDDTALFGFEQTTNSCCPINTDCSCFLNVIFGCGGGGCGDGL